MLSTERPGAKQTMQPPVVPPVSRRLRSFSFDPSLATRLDTCEFNQITLEMPWEPGLQPGPVGEYLEVVDHDPASGVFYHPVDLNDGHLLAQDGLTPSESNPQFHQQMVYAVAMRTIQQFERALGRVAFWADHWTWTKEQGYVVQFVRRLRIYPHALRDRNAYYSPSKKALLFGYFPVATKDKYNTPGTLVFTCLSHDIIAHEVTHALLDGVHPRFNEPTNPDVHAFHEAFADIVALFQHFSYPSVLESQIRRTQGDLDSENLLSQLAQQFGRATGRGSALRDALGAEDKQTGVWQPATPDPHKLERTRGPHARGAVLVAAVFSAFLLIYRARTADLFRIATNGTGVLPEGDLHPDLIRRLAIEGAESADRVLQMCIRAIDYCPPVDITFGDFLRGIVTADLDSDPADQHGYRVVFIESFREWGIHPRGVTCMGQDALAWPTGDERMAALEHQRTTTEADLTKHLQRGKSSFRKGFLSQEGLDWTRGSNRFEVWQRMDKVSAALWRWLREGGDSYGRAYSKAFGLVGADHPGGVPPTVYSKDYGGGLEPTIEVHSVRPAIRRTAYGGPRTHLVVEITQRRRGYFDRKKQRAIDGGEIPLENDKPDFKYRAGCTLLIDPSSQQVRRVMRTVGDVADDKQLERVRRFRLGEGNATANAFDAGVADRFGVQRHGMRSEPFALLHDLEEV